MKNNISDLKHLVENTNYGEYGELHIWNNPLNQQSIEEYIPILEARGIQVYYGSTSKISPNFQDPFSMRYIDPNTNELTDEFVIPIEK